GDALANADAVLETLRNIRAIDNDVLFCISTNGLLLPRYAEALCGAGVSHITVTVNAATPETAQKIYRYADYDGRRYTRAEAARLILQNQIEGIQKAAALGMLCKVNIVAIPGLNTGEIPAIMRRVKDAGASLANIMPLIPVEHTLFENFPRPAHDEIAALRAECEPILPQMTHCRHCRADAAGMLCD
ncbi:MAG: radical SAM protein, partial [Spirochaetaceae bacterium]|nr:radical SAM protein [Spirochaetaceae bacterium]